MSRVVYWLTASINLTYERAMVSNLIHSQRRQKDRRWTLIRYTIAFTDLYSLGLGRFNRYLPEVPSPT